MHKRFANKVFLVTGGSRGIGRAVVLQAAAEGATVIVNYAQDDLAAEAVVQAVRAQGGEAAAMRANVADALAVRSMLAQILATHEHIDMVVNSHGIVRRGSLQDITEEMWEDVLAVNLKGVFWVCQASAAIMLRQKQGAIVNIASMRGVEGSASSPHYAAAKGGVIAFTKSLARELAPHVRANCVAPGYTETRMQASLTPEQRRSIEETTPLRRLGTPEEVAAAVIFLASDDSAFITGQTLLVDGGRVML
ncbi:MAG: 3-oxoacyl-ACP reductase FabG [Cyanobacteria bacterium NC_groundwater_1444_Ag_S-0.65um_54_12]|nr:3-oxoacyl-ACP reductase FabG [Cyanobacteria bacterium NC_groundwater_1444_Ag_S-0.65um_54_12]